MVDGRINTAPQLELAFAYLEKNTHKPEVDIAEFEKAAGVGVVTTEEDIKKAVRDLIEAQKTEL